MKTLQIHPFNSNTSFIPKWRHVRRAVTLKWLLSWLTLFILVCGGTLPSSAATYTIPIADEWVFIGVNLDTSSAGTLDNMFSGNISDGTTLRRWNVTSQQYEGADTYFDTIGWRDLGFGPAATLVLGQGAIVNAQAPLPFNITVTGNTPPVTPVPVNINPGEFYLLASQNLNNPSSYSDIVGHNNPPAQCTVVAQYVPGPGHTPNPPFAPPSFNIYTYTSGQWIEDNGVGPTVPKAPQIARGESVWILGPQVITILSQPQSITTNGCSAITFSVETSIGGLRHSYQWEKSTDGGSTWVPIPSATVSSYTIYPVSAADVGLYRVVIHNGCSTVISDPAALTYAPSATIQGVKFNDANGNGKQNGATEYGIPNWTICLDTVPPGTPRYTTTDANGNYSFCVPTGTYTVSEVQQPNWVQTAPATGTHTVTLTPGQVLTGTDFGNRPTVAVRDLAVDITAFYPFPLRSPCCGQEMTFQITYRNLGTKVIHNPKVELLLSGNLTCLDYKINSTSSALPCPSNGKWSVPGAFVPGASGTFFVRVKVDPCPSGQTPVVAGTASIPLPTDDVPGNNIAIHSEKARCSIDPNDKRVTPKGCGALGLISQDVEELTYQIRFQNIGTGPAFRVIIRDELDPNLDLTTIEQLGSSHPHRFEVNGRELVWTFWDIVLPSASVDELGSQGYIKFRVRLNPSPFPGLRIENTGAIYFDLNDPVITGTTLNTITADPQPVAEFTHSPQPNSGGRVYDFTYAGGTTGATFSWDFGPGAIPQTSTDQDPTGVQFPIDGARLVMLQVDLGACESEPAIQAMRIGRPNLDILREGSDLYISWPGDGFGLEETESLAAPISWSPNLSPAVSIGGENVVILPVDNRKRSFRLRDK